MSLEDKRNRRIQVVINSINKAKSAGLSIDYEKIINEVCLRFGVARRTGIDYITLAMANTGTVFVQVENITQIINPREDYQEKFDEYKMEWVYLPKKEIKPVTEP